MNAPDDDAAFVNRGVSPWRNRVPWAGLSMSHRGSFKVDAASARLSYIQA